MANTTATGQPVSGGPPGGAVHLSGPKRKLEEGEIPEVSPFAGLQKNAVMREAKIFNDRELNPGRCSKVLTRILYLITQGETFTGEESTELFFAVTKLFQSQDVHLRRMIYLVIKELKVGPDESLIVVSCLSKDMTSKTDLFRANSIRVLARIMEPSMLAQMERFLKQAAIDKNPFIVSSTLVAGAHLWRTGSDVIKRWVTEVQEALNSKSRIVQFHALTLLHRIKQNDRLAISKVVTALAKAPPKGSLVQCMLIRIIQNVMTGLQTTNPQFTELLKYLVDSLHNTNSMVMFEAARAICRTETLTALQTAPAIVVLQEFLSSPIPTQRFAAVRALNDIVGRFPYVVAPCRADLEHLITDSNRTIATLAITALLKTGVEANVDRLMKSITSFMSEISDDFKIVLVDAIKTLCLKFPAKYPLMMAFLSSSLREEGGFKYKKAIVDAMLAIINTIKEAKESGMEQFCEYIEDCEFPELSIKILNLLGEEGANTSNPAKFVRYVFNRVILETASVRAAAVIAVAKFGASVPSLTDSVMVLLQRCLHDNDDEVRDRALYMTNVLKQGRPYAKALLFNKLPVSLPTLELSLQTYLDAPIVAPFSLQKHLKISPEDLAERKDPTAKPEQKFGGGAADGKSNDSKDVKSPAGGAGSGAAATAKVDPNLELLNSIPELKALGERFKWSAPVEITESDTDYVVTCVKHIYPQHVVFQFNVTNNMDGHVLDAVQVEMESEKEDWQEEFVIPEESKLAYQARGVTFVCFQRPAKSFASGPLTCNLKFQSREVNAAGEVSSNASEDEYQLEEIEVSENDFMRPESAAASGLPEFRRQWESFGESMETLKKYQFPVESLQAAVKAVMDLLGMAAIDNSHVVPEDKNSHAVNLAGTFFGDITVLVRAGFMLDTKHGVTLKVAVRCKDQNIRAMLLAVIR